LLKSEYGGVIAEQEFPPDAANLYTRAQLESIILASSNEIDSGLASLSAVEINGYIRILSRKAVLEVVQTIVDTIIENDWDIQNIDMNLIRQQKELSTMDNVILEKALLSLSSSRDGSTWQLSFPLIAKATAHNLFSSQSQQQQIKGWPVDDFDLTWSTKNPGKCQPSEEILKVYSC
jgi:hypothetical protein